MNANEQLIHDFYSCFATKNHQLIGSLYSDDATFSDPVFKNLNAAQVRKMWEMLFERGDDLRIEFSGILADETQGSAHWDAYYTFSATGKKVINRIESRFNFKDGKIIQQTDHFNFHSWATQALGITGFALGWTGFLKKKIQRQAFKNLEKFMISRKNR